MLYFDRTRAFSSTSNSGSEGKEKQFLNFEVLIYHLDEQGGGLPPTDTQSGKS
jgi:hypothetical protein